MKHQWATFISKAAGVEWYGSVEVMSNGSAFFQDQYGNSHHIASDLVPFIKYHNSEIEMLVEMGLAPKVHKPIPVPLAPSLPKKKVKMGSNPLATPPLPPIPPIFEKLANMSAEEIAKVLQEKSALQQVTTTAPPVPAPPPKMPFVVAVTGHRPDKLGGYITPNPFYDLVVKGLADAINKFKPDYLITGMSQGVDQWAAEICLNVGIPYVAAIPFQGQECKWPAKAQARYHWLLSKAHEKYVICQGGYEPWKMQKRNEWMVNSCQQMIAVWNGTAGGTNNCVSYATHVGKPIEYVPIPPPGMEVGEFFEKMMEGGASPAKAAEGQTPKAGTKRIVEI